MILCDLDENLVCRRCGWEERDKQALRPIRRRCRASAKPIDPAPSRSRQLVSFVGAMLRHIVTGCPVTTTHARQLRLAICRACSYYDGSRCSKCGCGVKTHAAFIDKLGWAEQRCPVGKWGPVRLPRKPWGARVDFWLAELLGWWRYLSPYEPLPAPPAAGPSIGSSDRR